LAKRVAVLVEDEKGKLASMLHAKLTPDVALSEPAPEIGFVHRTTDAGEVYFVANTAIRGRA